MATWNFTDPTIGLRPAIQETGSSTLTDFPMGMVARGKDNTLGQGEFILLTGCASTVIGSVVTWNEGNFQSALLIASAASINAATGRPVAVAMSANLADAKGWYMIKGATSVVKNTLYPSSSLAFSSSAAGSVKSGTTSGQAIERMFSLASTIGSANSAATAATDTVVMMLEYPMVSAVPPTVTG